MKILLDTNVFLWWIADQRRLSPHAETILRDPSSELLLSAASGWEIAIKTRLGKIKLATTPEIFVPQHMSSNRIAPLAVEMRHALQVSALPDPHRDPFDRLIIAQCQVEGIPIVTNDAAMARYGVKVLW
ncbi:MAG: type II toxin-antitoxin system VapC family toxin [Tepidisphaeraceae bacterium]